MTTLEHVAIAVEDAEAAIALIRDLLGLQPYKTETVQREGVRTHFIGAGGTKIELLESLGSDSPVGRFLGNRGEGVHHLAFQVDDLEAVLGRAKELGVQALSSEGLPGADRKRIAFFHPRDTHGVLIEICEDAPEAGAEEPSSDRRQSSACVVIVADESGPSRDVLGAVARMLEPRLNVEIVAPAGLRQALDAAAKQTCADGEVHVLAETLRRDPVVQILRERDDVRSVALCELLKKEVSVEVVGGPTAGVRYVVPAVSQRSRESVRLVADLLARVWSDATDTQSAGMAS